MEQNVTKKPVNLYLIFAAVIVIVLLVVGYFALLAPASLPRTFFSQYQEQDTLVKQVAAQIQFDYGVLGQQIQAKNASAAAEITKGNLIQSLKNKENTKGIQKKTGELKTLLLSVTDTTLREKCIKLFSLLDQRNKKLQTITESQVTVFTALRNYYGVIAVGGTPSGALPTNIDSVIQSSQVELQSLLQLQTTIDVAYSEIVRLGGGDTSVSGTADSIRMSLSATPEMQPAITDFPTPIPTLTVAPPPTIALLDPASSSAIASPSAE